MGDGVAWYRGFMRMQSGLTRSTEHPSKNPNMKSCAKQFYHLLLSIVQFFGNSCSRTASMGASESRDFSEFRPGGIVLRV